MFETDPLPQPPEIREKGFRLANGRFTAANGDVRRAEGSLLRIIFDTRPLRLKREQKLVQKAAKALDKEQFLAGQLRHYGIKFPSSADRGQLFNLLRDAVFAGKCDQVPASVMLVKDAMERRLAPLQQKWEEDVRAWGVRKKRWEDEAFGRCTTPGERANCDVGRFLDYYFLTNGQPDPTKTPEALALYGFDDRMSLLHHRAKEIPGLCTMGGGPEVNRTVCIGWDPSAVMRLVMAISRQDREEKRRKQESEWEKAMEVHHDYASKSNKESKKMWTSKLAEHVELGRCIGSYIVKCDVVSDLWPGMGGFTMDIWHRENGTLIADYHFGIIEGSMLLGTCEETLDELAGTWDDSGDGFDHDSFDSVESDSDDDENDEEPKLGKRPNEGAGPAPKQRKIAPSLTRRVYYRLRGCDTGEGDVIYDPESGHLDFVGDSYATFVGLAYNFPWVGPNVEFRGFKVSDVPQRQAADWDDLTREACEY